LSILTVNTPFNIDLEFSLAPFVRRALAWLLDYLIIILYSYAIIFLIVGTTIDLDGRDVENILTWQWIAVGVLITIPVMFYHLIFELVLNGRSPGKMLMGLQVMNIEGASPTLSQYVLRWMLCAPNYMVAGLVLMANPLMLFMMTMFLGFIYLPGIIAIAVTAKSQRLADLAAGTVVVDVRRKINISETIYVAVDEEDYTPLFPQVLTLSDKDLNGIRNLLSTKPSKERDNYMLRVAYRIEEVLQVKMNGEPVIFLQTLLKDYNYLTQSR